jgi:hypothetical protein
MANGTEQLEINLMAQFFGDRSDAAGIVVITKRPELLANQFPKDIKVFAACNPLRIKRLRQELGPQLPNVTFIPFQACNKELLKDKILICVDYLPAGKKPSVLSRIWLKRVCGQALLSILDVPASPDAAPDKTYSWLSGNKTLLAGRAKQLPSSAGKDQLIALNGWITDVRRHKLTLLPVLAVMHVYNEQDIIASTIQHLLDQGIDVHVIDNWSTDDTYSIVKSLASKYPRITYEQFPEKANNKFELAKMLTRVTEVAKSKPQYKWVMLNDADEIRWSPWPGVNLQEAFSFIDSLGYSAADYTVFNFSPTKEGFSAKHDPLNFFEYGEFSGQEGHFVQVKSWKNNPEADLAPTGGHHVAFPNQRIFPFKFLLGHYPIRSSQHGREKVFRERKARFSEEERKKGWHVQYDGIDEKTSFIRDPKELVKFGNQDFWQTYLLERLSGVGIKRD